MLTVHEIEIHPDEVDTYHGSFISRNRSQIFFSTHQKQHCIRSWIKENIRKKECKYYVENTAGEFSGKEICMCGYRKASHSEEAVKHEEFLETWDPKRHVSEEPTDAYGDITFTGSGQNVGKFVRVSSDTKPDTLYKLMRDHWGLNVPNLLISVTGGAKNFNMKPRLKNMFRRGLIKVARSTGAWIVTGGSHAGVMKHVGEAVRDYTMSSSSKDGKIVAIGIATWGIVHNRKCLVSSEGKFPAEYTLDEESQGRLSCLDTNHSHFILVDNGTHGKYGVEIALRGKLEKFICEQTLGSTDNGIKIPVVCVVLEGGPGTLDTIYSAMMNGTPCVVMEGSGRVADVIAQVANLPLSEITISHIQKQLKTYFAEDFKTFSDIKILEWTKKIQDIVRMQQLLTVFRLEKEDQNDVDVAIIKALLKASKSLDNQGKENWDHQLKLAVAWNRVDIAKSEIFTDDKQWKSIDLSDVMLAALLGDKPDFVKLFLENGVHLKEFLTEKRLLALYNNLPPTSLFLRRILKKQEEEKLYMKKPGTSSSWSIQLYHVSDVLCDLLGSIIKPLYPRPRDRSTHAVPIPHIRINLGSNDLESFQNSIPMDTKGSIVELLDPTRDLFIWAILENRKEIADIIWQLSQDCIATALAASKILKELAKEEDTDLSEDMGALAEQYEKQAIGVFTECHQRDELRAQKLLTRESGAWGNTTCLHLAVEANNKNFVAQGGVQTLLTQIWWGELAVDTRMWKVLLCMFLFPLIYTGLITFRRDGEIKKRNPQRDIMGSNDSVALSSTEKKMRSRSRGLSEENLKPLTRLSGFYSSPAVIFYWNVLSYFGFLWLFAYVLMMDFQVTPSWKELLLYIWLFTLVCEEIRQFFHDPDGFGFRRKAVIYFSDPWNQFDVVSICIFIAGLACRLTPTAFYEGRIILALDFNIWCLHLMAIFTVNKNLGPKIIIVKRMMKDIFFFLFLLVVWVVAYGVANQAILVHNEERLEWIFRGAVYEPYLTIFGHIPEKIDHKDFDISRCTVAGTDPLKPKCPVLSDNNQPAFPHWVTIIFLCIYLLFANILLLNLLIAMFNYTFQDVQDNTDKIWKFQRYGLIVEYHSQPPFPPPLIIFSHLHLLIERIFCKPKTRKHFKEKLPENEETVLLSWETFMKENYLTDLRNELNQSTDNKIRDTSEKVGMMVDSLERDKERQCGIVEKRLAHLEEQALQSAKALNWIMNALKNKGYGCQDEVPLLSVSNSKSIDTADMNSTEESEDGKPQYHLNARQLIYPASSVKRFPVPDEKVPWEVQFAAYSPTIYNSDSVSRANSENHKESSDVASTENCKNPVGRTGLEGKGKLYWFGPNRALDPIITRWKRSSDDSVSKTGTKKVLEFIAIKCKEYDRWAFPGGVLQVGETLPKRLKQLLNTKLQEEVQSMLGAATKVYEGYVDDPRNTDNAWVETTAINIHFDDTKHSVLEYLNTMCLQDSNTGISVRWQVVDQKIPLYGNHKEILQKVAQIHNAHY
ncbi:transient receptor potential cation channel subfamily M member 2-like isoform X1 [Acipenser ruthenus]|uniref:transient receptor potential cation channel subfamily M member 2-like isoform X1 n=1 Tax=Acipenser ruthenus TaxID=7906 RepID=UPI0027420F4E|nr:transient receptor potential cation channel subfamily M member 2-like isoform X1 [Acipenser ruthenus]XP_058889496.1 transient receptor potential cation channel subfamily M member 2-like isoform X1 [Acipenser ruthenus]XP_058889497.1 transient receptor potential cation channel subfamily M member 2-like isoform X1 [Acipenser ruthenus]XP_058889498.1 transient receptor potential cation channel subfamily M member 2-like isoform X1 [Acipenser ruthenus]